MPHLVLQGCSLKFNSLYYLGTFPLQVIAIVTDSLTDLDIFKDLQEACTRRNVPVYVLLDQTSVSAFLKMCNDIGIRLEDLRVCQPMCTQGVFFCLPQDNWKPFNIFLYSFILPSNFCLTPFFLSYSKWECDLSAAQHITWDLEPVYLERSTNVLCLLTETAWQPVPTGNSLTSSPCQWKGWHTGYDVCYWVLYPGLNGVCVVSCSHNVVTGFCPLSYIIVFIYKAFLGKLPAFIASLIDIFKPLPDTDWQVVIKDPSRLSYGKLLLVFMPYQPGSIEPF